MSFFLVILLLSVIFLYSSKSNREAGVVRWKTSAELEELSLLFSPVSRTSYSPNKVGESWSSDFGMIYLTI